MLHVPIQNTFKLTLINTKAVFYNCKEKLIKSSTEKLDMLKQLFE